MPSVILLSCTIRLNDDVAPSDFVTFMNNQVVGVLPRTSTRRGQLVSTRLLQSENQGSNAHVYLWFVEGMVDVSDSIDAITKFGAKVTDLSEYLQVLTWPEVDSST